MDTMFSGIQFYDTVTVNPNVCNLLTGPLFDWIEDSHAFGFYLQGVSSEMCKLRNYILYTGTFY